MAEPNNTRPDTEEWPVTGQAMALVHERLVHLEARANRLEKQAAHLEEKVAKLEKPIASALQRITTYLDHLDGVDA